MFPLLSHSLIVGPLFEWLNMIPKLWIFEKLLTFPRWKPRSRPDTWLFGFLPPNLGGIRLKNRATVWPRNRKGENFQIPKPTNDQNQQMNMPFLVVIRALYLHIPCDKCPTNNLTIISGDVEYTWISHSDKSPCKIGEIIMLCCLDHDFCWWNHHLLVNSIFFVVAPATPASRGWCPEGSRGRGSWSKNWDLTMKNFEFIKDEDLTIQNGQTYFPRVNLFSYLMQLDAFGSCMDSEG